MPIMQIHIHSHTIGFNKLRLSQTTMRYSIKNDNLYVCSITSSVFEIKKEIRSFKELPLIDEKIICGLYVAKGMKSIGPK